LREHRCQRRRYRHVESPTSQRSRNVQPIIDGCIYALLNLVERCFSKLKHNRRLATRYDKTADSFIGFVHLASIRLWVRHLVNRT